MLSIKQVEEMVYSLLHISSLKDSVTSLKLNHESLTGQVSAFKDKQGTLWEGQSSENDKLARTHLKFANQVTFKFEEQKSHNEATAETILHLTNKQQKTQKEVDAHHNVHLEHVKRMSAIEKDLSAFKHEIDQKTEKKFDKLETNLHSTDETIEKNYYEMLHKFE